MYFDYNIIKFNSIIKNIKIEPNQNLREIFDAALNYQYGESEKPISFKESNIKRIMVNSIRHRYSNYEDGLKQIHRLRMSEEVYFRYKNIVLHQISQQYPFLQDECESQKHKINMVKIIEPVE